MSRLASRATAILAVALSIAPGRVAADLPPGVASPCAEGGDSVTVITRKRELWLCHDGSPAARFQVAIGRGGVDKHHRGDGKTPLGSYTLGAPRSSSLYGTFIPIDYPTTDQTAHGFTGSEVGIHGPPRGLSEPDYPTTVFDWTEGCIATGTDAAIDAIAAFVRDRQPALVVR